MASEPEGARMATARHRTLSDFLDQLATFPASRKGCQIGNREIERQHNQDKCEVVAKLQSYDCRSAGPARTSGLAIKSPLFRAIIILSH